MDRDVNAAFTSKSIRFKWWEYVTMRDFALIDFIVNRLDNFEHMV